MTAPTHTLYRPTLHQIRVFDRGQTDAQVLLAAVQAAVEHVAHVLAPEAAEALRSQVAPSRPLILPAREARYPLVRSTTLYPVPEQLPLHAALLIYQEGANLLLHCTWHWDGEGDQDVVRHLLARCWPRPAESVTGDRGESLLLTAVPLAGKECVEANAAALFHLIAPSESAHVPLTSLVLDGATLSVQKWLLPRQASWPALLLFHHREVEARTAADRLVTVDWPLVALYHLRLEHYLQDYRERVAPVLQRHLEMMHTTLAEVFALSGTKMRQPPRVLTTTDPQQLQGAVVRLAEPQYALLETLGEAESAQHHVRRELENLQQSLTQMPLVASTAAMAPVATAATLHAALAGHAQHGLRQIEADVAQVQHQAERRTARAVEVLRTRTDIINTLYDRRRNWLIALVGVLLTLGQVMDKDMARLLYTDFGLGPWWERLGFTPLSQATDKVILYIRLLSIAAFTLGIAALIMLWMRLQTWRRARRP
jgi:hypothetical protein